MRAIPNEAVELVARWEGCELTAYYDIVGVLTVGYGSTGPHVKPGQKITQATAKSLLRDDLKIAARRLYGVVKGEVIERLTPGQYAALLSFVFNLGANAGWTIWKKLNAGALDEVPGQLIRFNRAGGKVVRGLVNRRADECKVWWSHAVDEPVPSHVTRTTPTPPQPEATKPIATSKSFVTTAASGAASAGAGVSAILQALQPHAETAEIIGRTVQVLAITAAAFAVVALVLQWMKKRQANR